MTAELENVYSLLSEIKAKLEAPKVEKIICDLDDIAVMFGKSKQSAFRIVKAQDFPTPIYSPGALKRCWLKKEVEAWTSAQKLLQNRKHVI